MESSRIPQVKSTLNQTSAVSSNGRSVGTMSQYGVQPPVASLREGDIVQAEITDLRNNEITIVMDDNTMIKGHLTNNTSLSIGQTASFRLAQVSVRGIVLEAMAKQYSSSQLAVIRQALEEAGLPDNEKNETVVRELMNNKMPINRQAISLILSQSYQTGSEDISSLVLMNKHHMSISPESVAQFSDYRNYEHQLISKITQFSEDLPSLLQALSENGPKDAVANFGHAMLSFADFTSDIPDAGNDTISFLSEAEREELLTYLEDMELSDADIAAIKDGNAQLKDVILALQASDAKEESTNAADGIEDTAPKTEASIEEETVIHEENTETPSSKGLSSFLSFGKNLADNARASINSLFTASPEQDLQPPKERLLERLEEEQHISQNNKLLTGSLLTKEERTTLLSRMDELPISNSLKTKIADGTASANEILQTIKNVIPLSDSESIRSLFQTEEFHTLYKEVLLKNFTLTPADLKNPKKVQEFYPKMESQLSSLENLIRSNLSGEDSENFAGQAKDMQDNIAFMKSLNNMFSCMQLPLKLSEQTAHGDLYVYTKKENLKKNPDNIRVLLHLDLEHLGTMDVHITKNGNHIDAKFYLEDTAAQSLLQTNTSLLADALAKKGYRSHIQTEALDKKADLVKDFMEADLSHTDMKRYTFDIRA